MAVVGELALCRGNVVGEWRLSRSASEKKCGPSGGNRTLCYAGDLCDLHRCFLTL